MERYHLKMGCFLWGFLLLAILRFQVTVGRFFRESLPVCLDEGLPRKDHVGTIHSPGYPLAYHPNTCRTWSIQGQKGDIITIHFQDLHIQQGDGGRCSGDYLNIGPVPEVTLCGNHSQPYISQRDHVWIKFMSDGSREAKGFELQYIVGPVPSVVCRDREYRCDNGKCILQEWRCDGQTHCSDGSDERGCRHVQPPSTTPPTLHCDGSQINCISAYTNQLVCVGREKICNGVDDCLYRDDEISPVCDGRCHFTLGGSSGTFHSPNYPNLYPNNKDCTWAIHIPIGTIQLHIVDFGLQEERETDFLEVYDGKNEVNTNIIGRYYGKHKPPSVINGHSNWMVVRFHSDKLYAERGFNATYQKKGFCLSDQLPCGLSEEDCYHRAQRCDGNWDCKQRGGDERNCGSCKYDGSGHYPCGDDSTRCYTEGERCTGLVHCFNNADEIGCTPEQCGSHNGTFLCRNSRCIYDNWRCDQTDDCGDSSDEENCPASRRVIIAAVIGSLICALLLVVALGCTCKLYALRVHEHYGSRHETPMSRFQDELNRRPAPPTYNEAMATLLPYDQLSQPVQQHRRSRGHQGSRSRSGRPPRPPPPRGQGQVPQNIEGSGCDSSARERTADAPQANSVSIATAAVPNQPQSVNSTNAVSELQSSDSTALLIPPSTTSESEGDSDTDTTEISMSLAAGMTVQFRCNDENRQKLRPESVFQNIPENIDINPAPSHSQEHTDSVSAETISASCDTDSALLSLDDPSDKQPDSRPQHASIPPLISISQLPEMSANRNSQDLLDSEGSDVELLH